MSILPLIAAALINVPQPSNVPDLMTAFDGTKVDSLAKWEKLRRPELKRYFLEHMYGVRPEAAEHPEVSFSVIEPDKVMMEGKALRKRVRITYAGPCGTNSFGVTAFIPRQAKPAPAFILICNRDPKENIDPERVKKSGFWPAEEIVERGYAAIAFFNGELAVDAGDVRPVRPFPFANGAFTAFERPQDRNDQSWAVLSAWAWGASRVMDWIETEPLLDAKHVAVVGHSRGGKTSLLAGVTDERFAMACVNDSGCGGAKLASIDLPDSEHYNVFLYSRNDCWFCGEFRKYFMMLDIPYRDPYIEKRKAHLKVDQHEWAALMAPRLLAIGSATEDNWAGQPGEFYTGVLASPAWKLYGLKGLPTDQFPAPDSPIKGGEISYHLRTGIHNLTPYDWGVYMDFADAHGWRD